MGIELRAKLFLARDVPRGPAGKIPSSRHQIPNKFQLPKPKTPNLPTACDRASEGLNFSSFKPVEIYLEFGAWDLEFAPLSPSRIDR